MHFMATYRSHSRTLSATASTARRGATICLATVLKFILLILTILTQLTSGATGATAPCSLVDYKIVSLRLLAVSCKESDVSQLIGSGAIYESSGTVGFDALPVDVAVTAYPGASEWLIVRLTQHDSHITTPPLQAGKKYKLALDLHPQAVLNPTSEPPAVIDIDVSNTVTVAPALAVRNAGTFEFVSHMGYRSALPEDKCQLQVEKFDGKLTMVNARQCRVPAPIPADITVNTLAKFAPTPEDIGSCLMTLDTDKESSDLPYSVPGLLDILGAAVKIDSKTQLVTEKAPTNKDSSSYYISFNYAGGRGSKPAWVLDGKITPPIGPLFHGFQFAPLATADVGQNQISNLTYTNTIDFGATLSRMYEPGPWLQGLLFHPAVQYESDKQFDRDNLLVVPDFRFNFIGLYNTRQRRTLSKFNDEFQEAQKRKIPWAVSNTKPVLLGYTVDFHLGAELGGALVDTTVKASVGTATARLPAYNIARIVPQAHAVFEVGRLSVDVNGTPRYLATVENSVIESPTHSLALKREHAWKALGVFTGAFNIDAAGHFAWTVTYKDGFAPPTYSRANTVQSGITIKY